MRTETGVSPTRRRTHRRFALVALTIVVLSAVVVPAFGQQNDGPPWRDLDAALRQLADAQTAVLDARQTVRDAEAELDRLDTTVDTNAGDVLAIAAELQATQDRARRLAVEAYVNGGSLTDALFVLDAESANDFAYRSSLLTASVGTVAAFQAKYFELRDAASDEAIVLAERIDEAKANIVAAEQAIVEAEAALPALEWVVTIAEIHRGADELMVRYNRIEAAPDDWDKLRFCESSRNYQINTGNGYYGAYQFGTVTWVDMGGTGLPSDASPEEQDARARYLYALRGSGYGRGGAWPVCGRFLPSG